MAAENLIDELLQDAGERMSKSVESATHEFSTVRTGRASPSLLDRVVVDYYGAMTPLNQLATISAPEARLLSIQPYDKSSIKAIERRLRVMDSTALALCMENGMPLNVFNMDDDSALARIISGERVGTLVSTAQGENDGG